MTAELVKLVEKLWPKSALRSETSLVARSLVLVLVAMLHCATKSRLISCSNECPPYFNEMGWPVILTDLKMFAYYSSIIPLCF